MSRRSRGEDGFTLIELMVVVLIIAILLAIAIPTFLGARERATDRAVQSDIRNAHTAERVFFTDDELFTEDPLLIEAIEPPMTYGTGDMPAVEGINIHVHSTTNGELYVSARSRTGNCFYLRDVPGGSVSYATDKVVGASCPMADFRTYTSRW